RVEVTQLIALMKEKNGEIKEITIQTDEKTEVRTDGKVPLEDLEPGMLASITPLRRGGLLISAGWPITAGVVQRVEGTKLILKSRVGGGEEEIVIETNGRTTEV